MKTRRCKRPGCKRAAAPAIGPGRPPSYCEEHRPASRSVDADAERERKASRARTAASLREKEAASAPEAQLLSVAAVLALAGGDPTRACALAGIATGSRAEAERLVAQARERHASLAEHDPAAIDLVLRTAILQLATASIVAPEAIAPAQRPVALHQIARVREAMGLTTAPRFTSITLELVTPDGTTETIGGGE